MSNPTGDLALLRRFEPVLRFTQGEQFFPMSVEPYVRSCSLWVQRPDEVAVQLVPANQLDLERLSYPYSGEFGTIHYLRLVEPYEAAKRMVDEQELASRETFHAGLGRLARVGYGSRLIDALFSISLLARGRVTGDTAAAAALAYRRMTAKDGRFVYYGRVVRENGWLVLQYWFFYPFNNWRSGFFGANDHEADWEMCCLYLSEDGDTGAVIPEWVAYASHDYYGDDLRRHWNDPEVEKVGEHPVVYIGAGSHACYFQPGEYLTEIELPFLAPLVRATDRVLRFWQQRLRQYAEEGANGSQAAIRNIFRIPFVDYARGDGFSIGPGQVAEWDDVYSLSPPPAWVTQYRGLWGLYTEDPFAGEDAPAGPMYNRNGSVRLAWYDPVGWAGLDKAPPRHVLEHQLLAEQARLRTRQQQLWETIRMKADTLQQMGVLAAAMRTQPHLYRFYAEHQEQIATVGKELDALRREAAAGQALLEALEFYAGQVRGGNTGPLRAHLRRAHRPASEARLRFSRLAEVWAALSVGLMMVVIVALFVFGRPHLFFGLIAALALFALIETGFRGSMVRLITRLTIGLSVVATLVIFYEYFWQIIIVLILITGAYILWENLREVWG
ncbi:MAG: hypothetical protein DCC55_07255 [Chloroflexi bacterium]|nr:MAG: hypothetical protein DCC55_07255 [Chloroflexota bacterium]